MKVIQTTIISLNNGAAYNLLEVCKTLNMSILLLPLLVNWQTVKTLNWLLLLTCTYTICSGYFVPIFRFRLWKSENQQNQINFKEKTLTAGHFSWNCQLFLGQKEWTWNSVQLTSLNCHWQASLRYYQVSEINFPCSVSLSRKKTTASYTPWQAFSQVHPSHGR